MPGQAYRLDSAANWIISGGPPPGGGGTPEPTATISGPSALETSQLGTWTLVTNATPSSITWLKDALAAGSGTQLSTSFDSAADHTVQARVTFSGGTVVFSNEVSVAVTAPAGAIQDGRDVTELNVGLAGVGSPALTVTGTFDTTADGQVIELIDTDGGFLNVRHDNVTVRRSRLHRAGTLYAVRFLGGSNLTIEDSDLSSEANGIDEPSSTIGPGSTTLVRCKVGNPGGSDLWKARSGCSATDTLFYGLRRVPGGHHDGVQMERSTIDQVSFLRSKFDIFEAGDYFNGCVQFGGWSSGQGASNVYFTKCYFNGGTYVFSGGVDSADIQGPIVLRDNFFGRDYASGLFRTKDGFNVDSSNVFADTLAPIPF